MGALPVSALLVADSVCKAFGGREVLRSATLRVEEGEVAGLVGRSGEGKSTLLRVATGLVRADRGHVFWRGELVPRPQLHRLAREGLFYLPAGRTFLDPGMRVRDHFAVCPPLRVGADLEAIVAMLGIGELLDARAGSLSTGERRRAEVAVALHRRPLCLLADEPLQGISPRECDLLLGAFRELAASGCAIVVTGHEVTYLFKLVDRVHWLTEGSIRALGSPGEAVESWAFRRGFLGTEGTAR